MIRPTIIIEFGEFPGTAIYSPLEIKDSLEIRKEGFPPEFIIQVRRPSFLKERIAGDFKETR
jgi:hypothetical protein